MSCGLGFGSGFTFADAFADAAVAAAKRAARAAGVFSMGRHFARPSSQMCDGTHSEWSAYGPIPADELDSLIPTPRRLHSRAVAWRVVPVVLRLCKNRLFVRSPCSSHPIVSFTVVLSRLLLIQIWAYSPCTNQTRAHVMQFATRRQESST